MLAVPNAALRTQRDVGSAAQVLGLVAGGGAAGARGAARATAAGRRGGDRRRRAARAMRRQSAGSGRSAGRQPDAPAQTIAAPDAPGGGRGAAPPTPRVGGRYIVFVKRNGKPTPVWIRTGLTDLDYSEVVEGLTGIRFGAGAAEREPGAVAAGDAGADEPDHRRRRVPGMQQQTPPSRRGARRGR